MHSLAFSLLSRLTLPIPSLCFLGITCELNTLDTRHCLRVCFGETPHFDVWPGLWTWTATLCRVWFPLVMSQHSFENFPPEFFCTPTNDLLWLLAYFFCALFCHFILVWKGGEEAQALVIWPSSVIACLISILISHPAIICLPSHNHRTLTFVYLFHLFACALSQPGILFWSDWQITTFFLKILLMSTLLLPSLFKQLIIMSSPSISFTWL